MAQPPPSATPGDTKEWERETWVAQMASLSNFSHHVPGDVSTPDYQQPAPSTYMALMYNLHYTLSTTQYHAPTGHWVVHGTDSLPSADYAPPPHSPAHNTYTRMDEPDDPHLWGTWERKSLDTLLSIRSSNQGLGRAMFCLAKWTQRTWGIPTDGWLWKVTLRPQQRGAPPKPQGTHPDTPHLPTALPVHAGTPPHGAAMAGPRHPHPKLPPPRGGGHARHPGMLLPHPRLPPANAPTRPGADMDTARVTHMPAQLRQHNHTATCPYTGTSTHGSLGKARAHAQCPNPHPRPHYSQDPASYARPRSPRPSAVPQSPLLRLQLDNLHHHNHLIRHHHHFLVQHPTPQDAGETHTFPNGPRKPVPTASNPAAAKANAPTTPAPAALPKRKTAAKQPPGPVGAPRSGPTAKLKPKPKPGTTTAARARPPEDVLYDIRPQPSQARGQQRPAQRPPAVTDAAATTVMAERAAVEARRTSFLPPLTARTPSPQTTPDRTKMAPGSTSSIPAPLQPLMSAHVQQMPRYRRHPESQPNPEAETVRAYQRVDIRPRPHSSRTPTAQDYEESPRPATATSPHDHVTPTNAHSSAQGHGSTQGRW